MSVEAMNKLKESYRLLEVEVTHLLEENSEYAAIRKACLDGMISQAEQRCSCLRIKPGSPEVIYEKAAALLYTFENRFPRMKDEDNKRVTGWFCIYAGFNPVTIEKIRKRIRVIEEEYQVRTAK